ncbi:hypothetical protein PInf_007448 [Phytophthora infestans]|nr:hypothetical protein PInf_007448 [Phytophthora infestans]
MQILRGLSMGKRVNSALVEYAKARVQEKDYELVGDDPDDVVAAAYVVAELGGFSSDYVGLVRANYDVLNVIEEYRKDIAWIERDWSSAGQLKFPFLAKIQASPDVLASEVAQLYRTATILRGLHSTRHSIRSTFGKMVGRPARNKQLNDVDVSKYSPICYAVDSISVTDEKVFIPDYPLSSCKFVLVPVHMIALRH